MVSPWLRGTKLPEHYASETKSLQALFEVKS
jgi:hypothetical protein